MSTFYLASDAERTWLLIALFVAILLALGLLFVTHRRESTRLFRFANIVLIFSFFGPLIVLCAEHEYISEGIPLVYHDSIPIAWLWCAAILLIVYELSAAAFFRYRALQVINRNSIKEAMDTMPDSICYFTQEGMLKLCNIELLRLYRTMAQSDLQSLDELHAALAECDLRTGVICIPGDEPVYLFPDGRAWMMTEGEVCASDGARYTEVLFYDVTELYERKCEIEAQTVKLRELGKSIRHLSANVAAMTKEEETLSFKTQLHDRMGAGLVAARQILLQNRPSAEIDPLIQNWKRSAELVWQEKDAYPERGEFSELMRDAGAIGVQVCLYGELPKEEEALEVAIGAMREGVTNCARHAHGTEVYVNASQDAKGYTLTLTNNGAPPSGVIVPRGGLSNLKRRVEYLGGTIEIQSQPTFAMTITMPKEREDLP